MAKPHVTRTFGPIHFEDLDPHRFEDLVRQLSYDLKQWQTIESTGRGGADDGFDVRAYEATSAETVTADYNDEDEQEGTSRPMEGNLWMIQCKREKKLGPKRAEDIIRDAVNPDAPPYGYILAAPAHFSKAAHDKFRAALRERGVMEFYLWGAGELEDMLYQPKNDHILFGFFGISLTSRRRSKTTLIRASVNSKNKLMRVLGSTADHKEVLVRDLKDEHYPYDGEYRDFDKQPRWKSYHTVALHPRGLIVAVGKYYAYIDRGESKFDFTKQVNLATPAQAGHGRRPDETTEALGHAVKGFWEQLPRANRTMLVQWGMIPFDSMAFVDDKGDVEHDYPHLFVDFDNEHGPLSGYFQHLAINEHQREPIDELQRIEIFPSDFSKPVFGKVYKDQFISLDDRTRATLRYNSDGITIYDANETYSYLKPSDVIGVERSEDREGKMVLLKITNVKLAKGTELIHACGEDPQLKQAIESQIARPLNRGDAIGVLEALVIYDWQIEQNRPVF